MIGFWVSFALLALVAMAFLIMPLSYYGREHGLVFNQYRWIILPIVALPLLAAGLYWHWGASDKVSAQRKEIAQQVVINAEIKKLGSVENIIAQLKQKVTAHPDSRG